MRLFTRIATLLICLLPAATTLAADWIERSNAYTQKVLDLDGRYFPESASQLGLEKFDTEAQDLAPQVYERILADREQLLADLKAGLASESDRKLKQDLEILITSVTDRIETAKLNRQYMLPYFSVSENVFSGLQGLLDTRNPSKRKKAAVERLKKYAGTAPGSTPIAELARARTEELFNTPNLTGPYVEELQKASKNTEIYITGIAEMFRDAKVRGWEQSHEKLAVQLRDYDKWIEKELMPRARKDNRLPEPIYADNLKIYGVTTEPRVLMRRAMQGFVDIRDEMQMIAGIIAREQKLPSSDYRDVLRELKKKQVYGDAIMPLYRGRLTELEKIIKQHDLVALPARESKIRLASEAESAATPAAYMNPPRLIDNQGEHGEFVLPLRNPNADPGEIIDDFTNEGFSWTLTAHESRPGHELQFSAMVEGGVSQARAIYAFNSANVEGWGLYAEALVKEYLPLEGQLFALQSRMMRASRAFLDPMLNLGLMKPEQAHAFLMEQVVLSAPMSTQEVDRYTFRAPGQATSYYVGYLSLRALRLETELAMGGKFNQRAFHDFILAQGLLPPKLLRRAVLEDFVGGAQ